MSNNVAEGEQDSDTAVDCDGCLTLPTCIVYFNLRRTGFFSSVNVLAVQGQGKKNNKKDKKKEAQEAEKQNKEVPKKKIRGTVQFCSEPVICGMVDASVRWWVNRFVL